MTGAPACAPDGDGFSLRALRIAASEWLRSNNLNEPQHSRNIDNQQQHNNQHDSSRENEAIHDASPSATCYTFIGGVTQHASAMLGLDGHIDHRNLTFPVWMEARASTSLLFSSALLQTWRPQLPGALLGVRSQHAFSVSNESHIDVRGLVLACEPIGWRDLCQRGASASAR